MRRLRLAVGCWLAASPLIGQVPPPTPRGDRIMDFSSAGYGGGGVPIPTVAAVERVAPSGTDDTAAIQAAIDRAAQRPLTDGFRGAVELAAGTYHCSAPLRIAISGVVVRGAGAEETGATILALGGKPHLAFELGKGASLRSESGLKELGPGSRITDLYVPSGTRQVTVADGGAFKPGEPVLILHPITKAYVHFMGMDGMERNGRNEHWISGTLRCERTVAAVDGNRLTLDLPLSDSLDEKFLGPEGARVVPYEFQGRIDHVGVEHLRIAAAPRSVTFGQSVFSAAAFRGVEDGWMRDCAIENTMETVQLPSGTRRVTIDQVRIVHRAAIQGAALPTDFALGGSQVLIARCYSKGNRLFYVATEAEAAGPNVLLNCQFEGDGSIMPHQRWATGLLVDNCRVPGGSIQLINRGHMGSGHGWTIGWGVVWNSSAPLFIVQNPPGALNWAIGCTGSFERRAMPFDKSPLIPQGEVQSPNRRVTPDSLYLAQLSGRLLPQGAK